MIEIGEGETGNVVQFDFDQGLITYTALIIVMGLGLGSFVYMNRSDYHNKSLIEIHFIKHCFKFVVALLSSFFNIRLLITYVSSGNDSLNASVLVAGIASDIIVSVSFFALIAISEKALVKSFSILTQYSLEAYVDFKVLHHKVMAVKIVSALALLDTSLLIFLPFRKSEFGLRSGGFPTLWSMKVILLEKIIISALRIAAVATASTSDLYSISLLCLSGLTCGTSLGELFMRLKAEDIALLDKETTRLMFQLSRNRMASSDAIELRDKHFSCEFDNDIDAMSEVMFRESFSSICDYLAARNTAITREQSINLSPTETADIRVSSSTKSLSLEKERDVENPVMEFRNSLEKETEVAIPVMGFKASQKHADENLEIYKQQLREAGLQVFEYMDLSVIRQEIKEISALIAQDKSFDENRLDYLIGCMKLNKDYIREQEEEKRQAEIQIQTSASEALQAIRAFIPPDVKECTMKELQSRGYSLHLSKRIKTVKSLWLTRYSSELINSMHIALLKSDFGYDGRNLDPVELLAVYASYPEKFSNDGTGKKQQYREALRDLVLTSVRENGRDGAFDIGTVRRHKAYDKQVALYGNNDFIYPLEDIVSSEGAFSRTEDNYSAITSLRGLKTGDKSVIESSDIASAKANKTKSTDLPHYPESTSQAMGQMEFHRRKSNIASIFARRDSISHQSRLGAHKEDTRRDAPPRNSSFSSFSSPEPSYLSDTSSRSPIGTPVPQVAVATILFGEVSNPLNSVSSANVDLVEATSINFDSSTQPPRGNINIADEIRHLSKLRDEGILTEKEFVQAKLKILNS